MEKFRGWLDGVGGLAGVEEYAREHNLTDLLLHVAFAWVVFRFVKSPIVVAILVLVGFFTITVKGSAPTH